MALGQTAVVTYEEVQCLVPLGKLKLRATELNNLKQVDLKSVLISADLCPQHIRQFLCSLRL
jgi:hypothetical protein